MASPTPKDAVRLVAAAGGEIIGRTRLQKVGCVLELAGAGFGFGYAYHLYGPYSELLSLAVSDAVALGILESEERTADWGGQYFVYRAKENASDIPQSVRTLAQRAAKADGAELELAVTAAYLAAVGTEQPWDEVIARKKIKATPERVEKAKTLYNSLAIEGLPRALPKF